MAIIPLYGIPYWAMQELSESLWKAKDEAGAAEKSWEKKLKQVQEQVEVTAASAKSEALKEAYQSHRALLQQLFPRLKVEGCDNKHQQWLENFEVQAQDLISTREKEVREVVSHLGHYSAQY